MVNHEKIRNTRRRLDLTQVEAAKESGITQSYLAEIERGKTVPSVKILCAVVRALGLKISEVLEA